LVARFLYYWLPIGMYAVLIFYLSTLPGSAIHLPAFPHADKFAHLCEYGGFGFLLARAMSAGGAGFNRAQAILGACLVASIYGASDEIHQFFNPTRSCEWGDWIADSLGGLVGGSAWFVLIRSLGRTPLEPAAPQGVA
jgi:VanZ family protein